MPDAKPIPCRNGQDPRNNSVLAGADKICYWNAVDLYIGGAEHAVLHLLYARFWHKFLYDIGMVPTKEPFLKYRYQGMILGENGEKMSKSRGNVINPDDIVAEYGADSMRLYEMFMGPLESSKPWNTSGLKGISRFLEKIWNIFEQPVTDEAPPGHLLKITHKTIKKITEDILSVSAFNTAISQMMILSNELSGLKKQYKEILDAFVHLLAPFAPHLGEELWERLGHKSGSLAQQPWPQYNNALVKDDEKEIVFQINGKLRSKKILPADISEEQAVNEALADEQIRKWISEKKIIKKIFVPGRLVNIVIT